MRPSRPPLRKRRLLALGAGLTTRAPSSAGRIPLERAVGQTLVMAFEGTAALLDYLDTAPLRETLSAGRRRRIKEGRFCRR